MLQSFINLLLEKQTESKAVKDKFEYIENEITNLKKQIAQLEKEDKKSRELLSLLVDENSKLELDIVDRISKINNLVSEVEITDDVLHAALSTRNEIIIRIFFRFTDISRIQPEQLEFFIPSGCSEKEKKQSYQLCLILVEKNYEFQKDETSQFFKNIILDIIHENK